MVKSIRYETSLHPYYQKPLLWERKQISKKHRHKVNVKLNEILKENEIDNLILSDKQKKYRGININQ